MAKENKWQKDIFIYTFAIQHLSISDILKEFAILFPQQITQVLQHVVCYLIISVLHDERMKVEIYFYDMLITYLCLGDLTGQGIKQSDNEVIQYWEGQRVPWDFGGFYHIKKDWASTSTLLVAMSIVCKKK